MAHAQKLLPIEQLLSDVAMPAAGTQRPAARPAIVSPPDRGGASNSPRRGVQSRLRRARIYVSPFAADSARKGTPRQDPRLAPRHIRPANCRGSQRARPLSGLSRPSPVSPEIKKTSRLSKPSPTQFVETKPAPYSCRQRQESIRGTEAGSRGRGTEHTAGHNPPSRSRNSKGCKPPSCKH